MDTSKSANLFSSKALDNKKFINYLKNYSSVEQFYPPKLG